MSVFLIVEDDVFIREMAAIALQDFGFDTLSASGRPEALFYLQSDRRIDAMFTDIYLKSEVIGGCELGIEAMKLRPALKVLYTTGNRVTAEMMDMFVNDKHFLSKPYTQKQLKESIDQLGAVG